MMARMLIGNGFLSGAAGGAAGVLLSLTLSAKIDPGLALAGSLLFSAIGWRTFSRAHLD